MRAYQQGIIVKGLRTRWLVIGIVETDQRIAQERRKLAARVFDLLGGCALGLQDLGHISFHLNIRVVVVVNA